MKNWLCVSLTIGVLITGLFSVVKAQEAEDPPIRFSDAMSRFIKKGYYQSKTKKIVSRDPYRLRYGLLVTADRSFNEFISETGDEEEDLTEERIFEETEDIFSGLEVRKKFMNEGRLSLRAGRAFREFSTNSFDPSVPETDQTRIQSQLNYKLWPIKPYNTNKAKMGIQEIKFRSTMGQRMSRYGESLIYKHIFTREWESIKEIENSADSLMDQVEKQYRDGMISDNEQLEAQNIHQRIKTIVSRVMNLRAKIQSDVPDTSVTLPKFPEQMNLEKKTGKRVRRAKLEKQLAKNKAVGQGSSLKFESLFRRDYIDQFGDDERDLYNLSVEFRIPFGAPDQQIQGKYELEKKEFEKAKKEQSLRKEIARRRYSQLRNQTQTANTALRLAKAREQEQQVRYETGEITALRYMDELYRSMRIRVEYARNVARTMNFYIRTMSDYGTKPEEIVSDL